MAVNASTIFEMDRPPAKRLKLQAEEENLPCLLSHKDIWVSHILPFLGPGHFAFVSGVSSTMKEFYKEYFSTISDNEMARVWIESFTDARETDAIVPATVSCTFAGHVFSSMSCVLYWEEHQGSNCWYNDHLCRLAAAAGNFEALKWARGVKRCSWDEETCFAAAGSGNLCILKWARENGCPWDKDVCDSAAFEGHLDVLKWARENGCPWNEETCVNAAREGHLDVLKWAREQGCPWNESTCSAAASAGRLDILKWAREQGCPWDEGTVKIVYEDELSRVR